MGHFYQLHTYAYAIFHLARMQLDELIFIAHNQCNVQSPHVHAAVLVNYQRASERSERCEFLRGLVGKSEYACPDRNWRKTFGELISP